MLSTHPNTTLVNSLNALNVKYTDTASMLSTHPNKTYVDANVATKISNTGSVSNLVAANGSAVTVGSGLSLSAGTLTATGGGTGTVTSVVINNASGLTGTSPITSTGTIGADTSILSTKANVTASLIGYAANALVVKYTDTASMLSTHPNLTYVTSNLATKQNTVSLTTIGTSGAATFNSSTGALNIPNYAGTVTSVATNTGSGITGGTITSSGTIAADTTTVLATKARLTASLIGYQSAAAAASTYVPYTGATTNVTLGTNTMSAGKIIASNTGTFSSSTPSFYYDAAGGTTFTTKSGTINNFILTDPSGANVFAVPIQGTGKRVNFADTIEANTVISDNNVVLSGSVMNPITTIRTLISGDSARIQMLATTNATVPTVVVIYFHGSSENQNDAFTNANEKLITDRLIANGAIVASSNAGGSLWGNLTAQNAYFNLYSYLNTNYTISKVIFIGQSMGALTSLNLIASARVPVSAWWGIYPATNLHACYYNEGFVSQIEASYGFSGSANYAAATAGFDPHLQTSSLYANLAYAYTASPSDAVIFKANNADSLFIKLNAINTTRNLEIVTTGNHGDISNFLPQNISDFCFANSFPKNKTTYNEFVGTVEGSGVPSNTIGITGNNNDFVGGNKLWALRTGVSGDFNIDVYNGGTQLNAFKSSQAGAISLPQLTSNGLVKTSGGAGALSIATAGTDYQAPITLTTTGTSGAATLIGNTLNIPSYSGGGGVTSVTINNASGLTGSTPITTTGTIGADTSILSTKANVTAKLIGYQSAAAAASTYVPFTGSSTAVSLGAALTVKGSGAFNGQIIADNTGTTGGGSFNLSQNGVAKGSFTLGGAVFGNTDANNAYYAPTGLGHLFFVNGTATSVMTLGSTGQLKLANYTTSTSFTGTSAGYLGFDASGNIITLAGGSGAGTTTNAVTFNNSNSGGASGSTFNGASGLTVSANTVGAVALTGSTMTGGLILPAATTSITPLQIPVGILNTTPVAGGLQADGNGFLNYTHVGGITEVGVVEATQMASLTTAYTLTSQTAAQKAFNSSTNGALTVAAGTSYFFEGLISLSSMSATSGSFGFALGGTATLTSITWVSNGLKAATLTTAATNQMTFNTTSANTSVVTANTSTAGYMFVKGIVRVNASGTLIPQVSLGIAAAAVVGVNSYFKLIPIGTNTTTNIGNWN